MTGEPGRTSLVVGVDPGVTTGLLAARFDRGCLVPAPLAVQIHGHQGVEPLVRAVIDDYADPAGQTVLAIEAFVVSTRAGRSGTPFAGALTRTLIAQLTDLAREYERGHAWDLTAVARPAAVVKVWASDRRLAAAGLLDCTKNMGHARDAARHALYAAVHAGITRDPLSARAAR